MTAPLFRSQPHYARRQSGAICVQELWILVPYTAAGGLSSGPPRGNRACKSHRKFSPCTFTSKLLQFSDLHQSFDGLIDSKLGVFCIGSINISVTRHRTPSVSLHGVAHFGSDLFWLGSNFTKSLTGTFLQDLSFLLNNILRLGRCYMCPLHLLPLKRVSSPTAGVCSAVEEIDLLTSKHCCFYIVIRCYLKLRGIVWQAVCLQILSISSLLSAIPSE